MSAMAADAVASDDRRRVDFAPGTYFQHRGKRPEVVIRRPSGACAVVILRPIPLGAGEAGSGLRGAAQARAGVTC